METTLGDLSNEILFMIYSYSSLDELFESFHGLNSRFHDSLIGYLSISLDIRCISRSSLQILCDDYLPLVRKRIRSLRLSDHQDCRQQIYVFHQYLHTFNHFTNLQSLSLSHIDSMNTFNNMIIQLQDLSNFTHLNVEAIDMGTTNDQYPLIFHHIWQLKHISNLQMIASVRCDLSLSSLEYGSNSLTHVKLINFRCSTENILRLLEHTLNLIDLQIHIEESKDYVLPPYQHSSIQSFETIYHGTYEGLTNILRLMPNLNTLRINVDINLLNKENNLSQFIREHLRNVHILELFISYTLSLSVSIEDHINQSFNSFDNIVQSNGLRQFPLRSDWQRLTHSFSVLLYTIPCLSTRIDDFESTGSFHSQTNLPTGIDEYSYDRLISFHYDDIPTSTDLPFHYSNLHHLRLVLPVNDQFRGNILRLDRLISLELSLFNENIGPFVQRIFDEAIHLRSVKFLRWPISLIRNLRHPFIRELDLTGFSPSGLPQYFDRKALETLFLASLVCQCVTLRIPLENADNLTDLVKHFVNLRVLIVRCKDHRQYPASVEIVQDDSYLDHLTRRLPPTCHLERERENYGTTRIWIQ